MVGKKEMIFVLLIIFILTIGIVSAEDPSGANITGVIDYGEDPEHAPENVSLQSGNITFANLNTDMSTYHWAGLIGNVTGDLILGDNDDFEMFTWTGAGRLVYASTTSVDWSVLTDALEADVTGIATWLGHAEDSDRYATTFTGGVENIGSGIFDTLTSDHALTLNSTGDFWKTYSLWDTTNLVWAALVDEDSESYRGGTVDFQMIVPEDGEGDDNSSTQYNIWVELI